MGKVKKKRRNSSQGVPIAHQIEAIITIDQRGQMVLPKETRDKAGIRAGDKLALVGWRKGDRLCCLSLVKVAEMAEMVTDLLESLKSGSDEPTT